jgi:hypothetical protein
MGLLGRSEDPRRARRSRHGARGPKARQRRPSFGRGSQYTSVAFGARCKEAGVRPSTGSVGDAYDNAMCESFFATLECELIDRRRFRSHSEARIAVFHFIEGFYNPSCLSGLDGGAEGIRTDGHRGFPAANRGISWDGSVRRRKPSDKDGSFVTLALARGVRSCATDPATPSAGRRDASGQSRAAGVPRPPPGRSPARGKRATGSSGSNAPSCPPAKRATPKSGEDRREVRPASDARREGLRSGWCARWRASAGRRSRIVCSLDDLALAIR